MGRDYVALNNKIMELRKVGGWGQEGWLLLS